MDGTSVLVLEPLAVEEGQPLDGDLYGLVLLRGVGKKLLSHVPGAHHDGHGPDVTSLIREDLGNTTQVVLRLAEFLVIADEANIADRQVVLLLMPLGVGCQAVKDLSFLGLPPTEVDVVDVVQLVDVGLSVGTGVYHVHRGELGVGALHQRVWHHGEVIRLLIVLVTNSEGTVVDHVRALVK